MGTHRSRPPATLGAGETRTARILLRFHPSGCNTGGVTRGPGSPTVELRVLGLRHRQTARDGFAFRYAERRTPGCRGTGD